MLLKFTAPDMLNSALVDVATGSRAYDITTVFSSPEPPCPKSESSSHPEPSSSSGPKKISDKPAVEIASNTIYRKTTVRDSDGKVVAQMDWTGRRPSITIRDEKIGGLTELFGSNTVPFMPKVMIIPTRFDTEFIWTATADSLTLFDYDSETVKGAFHQNVVRMPAPLKGLKSKPSRTKLSSSGLSSSSSLSSSLSSVNLSEPCLKQNPHSTFIPTHITGVGSNYLEFDSHPLADDVEIIISFLMMEIVRRGRFNLSPYTFEKPKTWQFKEVRQNLLRNLRRNTV
ncbi:hypothetical protein CVT24_011524 [Panaeolus cyanescens]|uniref:Uncharacterized protein n=1 Tax=Panaeolus cyanescens TaxID=181874 RepID=A0A409VMJ6_9AGAR|nr:hypothetical protein CVT24_011524 [Panaeolus cyanescens]